MPRVTSQPHAPPICASRGSPHVAAAAALPAQVLIYRSAVMPEDVVAGAPASGAGSKSRVAPGPALSGAAQAAVQESSHRMPVPAPPPHPACLCLPWAAGAARFQDIVLGEQQLQQQVRHGWRQQHAAWHAHAACAAGPSLPPLNRAACHAHTLCLPQAEEEGVLRYGFWGLPADDGTVTVSWYAARCAAPPSSRPSCQLSLPVCAASAAD